MSQPASTDRAASALPLEQSLRLLIDSIHDYAIFRLNADGTVASWNSGAQRIKGWRADEIIGRHFSTFYPPEDVAAGKCEHELEVAAATSRFEDEGWRVRKDGSRFWANVIITALRDQADRLIGFAKVTRDLTDRKRAEEERAARIAAEQANRAKDEFLAVLGHELRNPLAPIMTAIQLLRLRGHDLRELGIIERQAQHLVRLVDDLLDLSRIARGAVTLHREQIELAEVIAEAVETSEPLLEQRHHNLALEVPQRGCAVRGDRARLVQIFSNLLTNAAKYTEPQGHIVVTATAVDGRARVGVRDSGIGIPADMLDRVFEAFVQQPQSAERSMGGLGLGLAIVRSLVVMHGGTVCARSDGPGRGSEFIVDLPLARASRSAGAAATTPAPAPAPAGRRVLVVDDNVDAASLLAEAITGMGHEVAVAHDGAQALRVAGTFQPEIALLDIGLPAMDGYELAGHLRAEPWATSLCLIALTGYGQPGARQRSADAGFNDHLVKPIDLNALERLLVRDAGGQPGV